MDLTNLNSYLFAGKWAFIGLIYFILIVVVIAVRREMAFRRTGRQPSEQLAPGRLRVIEAGGDSRVRPGSILHLKSGAQLGADPDNDIVLSDPYVSGHHARLSWDGSAWWVEDLGSANGTSVDGRPCPPHVPQPLPAGARLSLGDTVLELLT